MMLKNYPKKELLWLDKAVVIVIFALLWLFQPDILLMYVMLSAFLYLAATDRPSLFYYLYVSGILAFIWTILAARQYDYNLDFMKVYGVTLFPFFSVTLGLFAVYLIYHHYEEIYKLKGYFKKLGLFTAIYIPLLLIAEKIGYEVFNIKNMAAIDFDPIAICECLHAAPWMQAVYLLGGPLYFSICYYLKLDEKTDL